MNTVILSGRIVKKPELRETQSGNKVCSFILAVDRFSKKDGSPDADFPRITCWNRTAEAVHKYCDKGDKVAVEGVIQTSTWENNEGTKVYDTGVTAARVEFMAKKTEKPAEKKVEKKPEKPEVPEGFEAINDSEIPL